MKPFLRNLQTYVPWLQDLRFKLQARYRSAFGIISDPAFRTLHQLLPKGAITYIDIGANRGTTIQDMLMIRPDAQIFAFEPNTRLADKLTETYRQYPDIHIYPFALSDREETQTLYIPQYRSYIFDGLASLRKPSAANWLKGRLWNFNERHIKILEFPVQLKKLDDFHLSPDFIKIDVQGAEHQVLLGASQTIQTHKPLLLIETPDEGTCNWLFGLDYKAWHMKNGELKEGVGEDTVFVGKGMSFCY